MAITDAINPGWQLTFCTQSRKVLTAGNGKPSFNWKLYRLLLEDWYLIGLEIFITLHITRFPPIMFLAPFLPNLSTTQLLSAAMSELEYSAGWVTLHPLRRSWGPYWDRFRQTVVVKVAPTHGSYLVGMASDNNLRHFDDVVVLGEMKWAHSSWSTLSARQVYPEETEKTSHLCQYRNRSYNRSQCTSSWLPGPFFLDQTTWD